MHPLGGVSVWMDSSCGWQKGTGSVSQERHVEKDVPLSRKVSVLCVRDLPNQVLLGASVGFGVV